MWVYEPVPETSSLRCCGSPQKIGRLSKREAGATYASMPMIGVTPAALACL